MKVAGNGKALQEIINLRYHKQILLPVSQALARTLNEWLFRAFGEYCHQAQRSSIGLETRYLNERHPRLNSRNK